MSRASNHSPLGCVIAGASLVLGVFALLCWQGERNQRRRPVAQEDVTRWEGEGGNVPEVEVQAGRQGSR
jgi:hypothetical protein